MHSDKLKAILQYAQAKKLRPLGMRAQVCPLAQVLKDLGFAKQRFDSTVDPAGKLALLLLPVTTVLAIIASDERNSKERRAYARQAFSFLDTKHATALGISADWGIVWEVFLRLFDVDDHDIAASCEQVEAHMELLKVLFCRGGIFDKRTWSEPVAASGFQLAPRVVHVMAEAGVTGEFITSHVEKQVAKQCEFNLNGSPVALWGPLEATQKTELGERLQNATALGIARVEADLQGKSNFRRHLGCFHLPSIRKAFGHPGQQPEPAKIQTLRRSFRELWQMLKLPFPNLDAATDEYATHAAMLAHETLPGRRLYGKTNRTVWSLCLDKAYIDQMCIAKGRPALFQHLFPVVRFYNAILDGTVRVERFHAQIRRQIHEREGQGELELTEDFVILRASNKSLEDMVPADAISRGELGDFGLACATKWRVAFGARMGIRQPSWVGKGNPSWKGKQAREAGSYTLIKKGVLKAAGQVASLAASQRRRGPDGRFRSMVSSWARRGHASGGPQPGEPKHNKFWNPRFMA